MGGDTSTHSSPLSSWDPIRAPRSPSELAPPLLDHSYAPAWDEEWTQCIVVFVQYDTYIVILPHITMYRLTLYYYTLDVR